MRKRHQALLISSQAKKKICNEIGVGATSYEIEQKKLLSNYFNDNIDEEDIEIIPQPDRPPVKEKPKQVNEDEESEDEEDLDD